MSAFPVEAGRIADLETPLQPDTNDPKRSFWRNTNTAAKTSPFDGPLNDPSSLRLSEYLNDLIQCRRRPAFRQRDRRSYRVKRAGNDHRARIVAENGSNQS